MSKTLLEFLNEGNLAKAKEYYDQIFYALKGKYFESFMKDRVNHIRSFDIKLNNTGLELSMMSIICMLECRKKRKLKLV